MTETRVDRATWPRAAQFDLFRTYDMPHYAVTVRLDVTHLITAAKPRGVSPYRACLFAIGSGVQAVPEIRMRFRGDEVVLHDSVALSMTVPRENQTFGYAYVPFVADFAGFDAQSSQIISDVADGRDLHANSGQRDDVVYLSCLPWLDFTSVNNALPGPDECIPRVSWGKFVENAGTWDMAMAVEVHHALVDGHHLGQYFAHVQDALNGV